MANPQESQRNIRKIAAAKHIAPGYEEMIYLQKGADGRWMATAMYSEGQIAGFSWHHVADYNARPVLALRSS